MKIEYIVQAEREGGYSASIPSMPGCFTEGDTLEELRENVRKAAMAWLEALVQVRLAEASAAAAVRRTGVRRTVSLPGLFSSIVPAADASPRRTKRAASVLP